MNATVKRIAETIVALERSINARWNNGDVRVLLRNELPNPLVIVSDSGDLAVVSYNLLDFVADGAAARTAGRPWNSTRVYRLIEGSWGVVHVNWSLTRHPAAMQGLMAQSDDYI